MASVKDFRALFLVVQQISALPELGLCPALCSRLRDALLHRTEVSSVVVVGGERGVSEVQWVPEGAGAQWERVTHYVCRGLWVGAGA